MVTAVPTCVVCFLKCVLPLGRLACFGRLSVLLVDGTFVLAAQFIEVVVRTSENQVGLETTIGHSPTVGSNEVSFVV